MSALVVQAGDKTAVFEHAFTIGRRGDFTVDDEYASLRHTACIPTVSGWAVEDLGSVNGTWLNGSRVWGPVPLAKGDKIKTGRTIITVVPA